MPITLLEYKIEDCQSIVDEDNRTIDYDRDNAAEILTDIYCHSHPEDDKDFPGKFQAGLLQNFHKPDEHIAESDFNLWQRDDEICKVKLTDKGEIKWLTLDNLAKTIDFIITRYERQGHIPKIVDNVSEDMTDDDKKFFEELEQKVFA